MTTLLFPQSSALLNWRFAALSFGALVLASCSGSSGTFTVVPPDGPLPQLPQVSSPGVSATRIVSDGELVAFSVFELEEGQRDLNGDGDAIDDVLFVHDAQTGETHNLELASPSFAVRGRFVVFGVLELAQGQDMNGDGDLDDQVLHVFDATTAVSSNLEFSLQTKLSGPAPAGSEFPFLGDRLLAFGRDADDLPSTLHLFDLEQQGKRDTGLEFPNYAPGPGSQIGTVISERSTGLDLNGDGDSTDIVAHVMDPSTGVSQNLGLALGSIRGIPRFSSSERLMAMVVDEWMSNEDLDGDGLIGGSILFTYNFQTGELVNAKLRVVGDRSFGLGLRVDGDNVLIDDEDGDLAFWSDNLRTSRSTGYSSFGMVSHPTGVIFSVNESFEKLDLNNDGDLDDSILHWLHYGSQSLRNLRVSALPNLALETGIVVSVFEGQDGQDLNGDGDVEDSIIGLFDTSTESLRVLPVEGFPQDSLNGTLLISLSGELGEDLNTDGDNNDVIVFVTETAPNSEPVNLGLAIPYALPLPRGLEGVFPFQVHEAAHGNSDLNGDGDSNDYVLFLLRVPGT